MILKRKKTIGVAYDIVEEEEKKFRFRCGKSAEEVDKLGEAVVVLGRERKS